jgi:uncharacterized glyoxalase superfamily protein PhnB
MDNKDFATKPVPRDWMRVSSAVFYDDAPAAIDWLVKVVGFEVRLRVDGEGNTVVHSELEFGSDGMIMVSSAGDQRKDVDGKDRKHHASPRSVGGANTQAIMVFVDDVDAHCAHARAHGAKITMEPRTSDYGEDYWTDRTYELVDLEGHYWWFVQRIREPKPRTAATPA